MLNISFFYDNYPTGTIQRNFVDIRLESGSHHTCRFHLNWKGRSQREHLLLGLFRFSFCPLPLCDWWLS